MSNSKKTQLNKKKSDSADSSQFKSKWSALQTDLSNALNDWSFLDQNNNLKSAEDEQREKVKFLIEDLKSKLNEF